VSEGRHERVVTRGAQFTGEPKAVRAVAAHDPQNAVVVFGA
jgi:hypothetical protein